MLGNSYIFFVDHQALLYVVNKPIVIGWIAKWILLLQEFDFKVVYKLSKIHFLLDHLLKISHGKPTEGIDDQLPNAHTYSI